MLFRNFTPFPPLQFESRDEKQNDFGVIVLRGTFQIENGKRLRLVQEQEPLVMADEYFGEPGASSLKFESNIAPYKPNTDVLVNSHAYSPSGGAEASWNVAVEVGDVKKELTVTGPRQWERSLGIRSLTKIQPVDTVPLRYEYAFGGSYREDDKLIAHEANPIGLGFAGPKKAKDVVPAPQVLPLGKTELVYGQAIEVEGLGPVAPAWLPRRDKAGTFNVVWEKTRWPDLPEDFSFDFYNTASPGLTLPFLKGDEMVKLTNLSRDGQLTFGLPCFELATLLRFEDGRVLPGPIVLDTVHIDVPTNRVYLNWRGVFPVNVPLRVLEVRMKVPEGIIFNPETAQAATS